jgi:allophanate hydrolase subunit 1
MTDVSRIADSTVFKIVVPVLQTILSAAAIGAFVYVVGSLSTLQTTLNSYQTSQALLAARVDSLERSRESSDKFIDTLRTSDQRQDFQINSITEILKTIGRPK